MSLKSWSPLKYPIPDTSEKQKEIELGIENKKVDVLVIGAGASGAAFSWKLAKSGILGKAILGKDELPTDLLRSEARPGPSGTWLVGHGAPGNGFLLWSSHRLLPTV